MDFNLSEEQKIFRDTVNRFISDEYSQEVRRKSYGSDGGCSNIIWQRYADLGLLSLCLPDELGGYGLSFIDTLVVIEHLARGIIVEPFVENIVFSAEILKNCDSAPSLDQLLRDIAKGRARVAVAHREHIIGKKLLTTVANETHGKIRVNGQKFMAIGAPSCDKLLVTANFENSSEMALILVDASEANLIFDHYKLIDDSSASDITFENVILESSAIIARGQSAEDIIESAADKTLVARLASALSVMEVAVEVTSVYVKEREQFGRPIGQFQEIKHTLSEMFVSMQAARSMFFYCLSNLEGAKREIDKSISAAKYLICKNGQSVTASAIQLHGGYGITDEYIVSHLYKSMLTINFLCGDDSFHLSRVAR